jgi:hypothetical protein
MRTPARHDMGHAARPWPHAFEHRSAIYTGVDDHQSAHVRRSLVFGVAQCAFDQLFEHASAALWLILQDGERIIDALAANQVGDRAHLAGADSSVPMYCRVCHGG